MLQEASAAAGRFVQAPPEFPCPGPPSDREVEVGQAVSDAMSIGMVMVEIKDDIDVADENFIGVKVTVEAIKDEHKERFIVLDFSDDLDNAESDQAVLVTSSDGPKGPPPPRPVNEPPPNASTSLSSRSDGTEDSSSSTVKPNPKKKSKNRNKKPSKSWPELSFATCSK